MVHYPILFSNPPRDFVDYGLSDFDGGVHGFFHGQEDHKGHTSSDAFPGAELEEAAGEDMGGPTLGRVHEQRGVREHPAVLRLQGMEEGGSGAEGAVESGGVQDVGGVNGQTRSSDGKNGRKDRNFDIFDPSFEESENSREKLSERSFEQFCTILTKSETFLEANDAPGSFETGAQKSHSRT